MKAVIALFMSSLLAAIAQTAIAAPVLLSAEARGVIVSGSFYSRAPYPDPNSLNEFSRSLAGLPISFSLTIWEERNTELVSGITGACSPASKCIYKGQVRITVNNGDPFHADAAFGYPQGRIDQVFEALTGPGAILFSVPGEFIIGGADLKRQSNDYEFLIAAESGDRNVYWALDSLLFPAGPGKMSGQGRFSTGYYSDELFDLYANFSILSGSITGGSLASVPEPSIWLKMLVGFGLVGMAYRRKRVRRVIWT